eukprot:GILJ01013698.1.p1 GENE.GILJ01013698.1~~GILJ01013698.1.p1  ORF type:complete len:856 (+),score=115.33 GILJ01013698.1:2-2569(+)
MEGIRAELGLFVRLTESLVFRVLAYLEAKDVLRMSCAHSVFYVFCNDEPLWQEAALLLLKDQVVFEESWQWTALKSLGKPSKPRRVVLRGFASDFLYRQWYRCNMDLSAFHCPCETIARIPSRDVNYETFVEKYESVSRPVLFTDTTTGWSAHKNWTLDKLVEAYGGLEFKIAPRPSSDAAPRSLQLWRFVQYLRGQHDEDPMVLADRHFGETAPSLLKDYVVSSYFPQDFFSVLDDQRPDYRWLVIGPQRSGTGWHVDPIQTSAWNSLISGVKRWAIYPPSFVPPGMSMAPAANTLPPFSTEGEVTPLQWFLDVYPTLSEDMKPLEIMQYPGDTIFVPGGWWHLVLNIQDTVAVTQNFVSECNVVDVCADILSQTEREIVWYSKFKAHVLQVLNQLKGQDEQALQELNQHRTEFHEYGHPEIRRLKRSIQRKATAIEKIEYLELFRQEGFKSLRELKESFTNEEMWRPRIELICKRLGLSVHDRIDNVNDINDVDLGPESGNEEDIDDAESDDELEGVNPVFPYGEYVFKFYAFSTGGMKSFTEEKNTLEILSNTALSTIVPSIVGSGTLRNDSDAADSQLICPLQAITLDDAKETSDSSDKEVCGIESSKYTWGWPYLVFNRLPGTNLGKILDSEAVPCSVSSLKRLAEWMGTVLKTLHGLQMATVEAESIHAEDWMSFLHTQLTRCYAKHIGTTFEQKRLFSAVEKFLPDANHLADILFPDKRIVFLHGDLNSENVLGNVETKQNSAESTFEPTALLDFGDAFYGDPLYDLVALHISMFRCDKKLLRIFLESYGWPERDYLGDLKCRQNFAYRAMCYTLLHVGNALGMAFEYVPQLATAGTLEEVATALWQL